MGSLVVLCVGFWPVLIAYRRTRASPLRTAVGWAFLALVLALVSQYQALAEPLGGGRPRTCLWAYLALSALLASTTSVLGARRPGAGAWSMLMIMLFLLLLVPLLESSLLLTKLRDGRRFALEAPWSFFVILIAVAGVTNYLPTRWSLAASTIGLGVGLQISALIVSDSPAARRGIVWSTSTGLYGFGLLATLVSPPSRPSRDEFSRAWFWFRDRWGVVWALRVAERFNESMKRSGLNGRLGWDGMEWELRETSRNPESSEEALTTLLMLIRRFATPQELEVLRTGKTEKS